MSEAAAAGRAIATCLIQFHPAPAAARLPIMTDEKGRSELFLKMKTGQAAARLLGGHFVGDFRPN
jgi:hypothetical protein